MHCIYVGVCLGGCIHLFQFVYTFAGFDFEFSTDSFVFESKITQLCTPVSILDDFLEEEREYVSFCLRIINPMRTVLGLYNSSTIVIEDNDSGLYTCTDCITPILNVVIHIS